MRFAVLLEAGGWIFHVFKELWLFFEELDFEAHFKSIKNDWNI